MSRSKREAIVKFLLLLQIPTKEIINSLLFPPHLFLHPKMAENGTPAPDATIILPPPAIKTIVDKTAAFIAPKPNAAQLEERFRQREQTDSRFAFLNPTNPYYAYYADRLAAFKAGEQPEQKPDDKVDGTNKGPDGAAEDDGRPTEPPPLEFLVEDPPKISAVDL